MLAGGRSRLAARQGPCLAGISFHGSAHGLSLIALGLPSAELTMVLMPLPFGLRVAREAMAAHGVTNIVAAPEAAAALAGP